MSNVQGAVENLVLSRLGSNTICQSTAAACEHLPGVAHSLSAARVAGVTAPRAVEQIGAGLMRVQGLAVGTAGECSARFPPRPRATASLAADNTVCLASLAPAPVGQFLSRGRAGR